MDELVAARARVATLLEADAAVDTDALAAFELPSPDPVVHAELRERAEGIARAAGRGELLAEAQASAREAAASRYSAAGYRPTWLGLNWSQSLGTSEARVSYALALEDAATVAVAEDLLDADTIDELTWAFGRVRELGDGRPSAGSLEQSLAIRSSRLRWLVVGLVILDIAITFLVGSYVLGAALLLPIVAGAWLARRPLGWAGQEPSPPDH
jgi:hypothetical protein